MDRAVLAKWRFEETNGFVVKDYSSVKPGTAEEPVVMVLKPADIFEFIADATKRQAKVAIYAIGPCVIDWT